MSLDRKQSPFLTIPAVATWCESSFSILLNKLKSDEGGKGRPMLLLLLRGDPRQDVSESTSSFELFVTLSAVAFTC
jgi:hypothetical protein